MIPFAAFACLLVQILLGALDNFLHHEVTEKLPSRTSARFELALHSARELIYGIVFAVFAWVEPLGFWAFALLVLLLIEIAVTLTDFLEEDRTRTLPPFERILHTLLAINFGVFLALMAPVFIDWARAPTGLELHPPGAAPYFLSACALGVFAWGVRDAIASFKLYRQVGLRAPPRAEPSGRTILVTGATGFIGDALVRRLMARGDRIVVLTRDPRRAQREFGLQTLCLRSLEEAPSDLRLDAIVNLAGAGVANALWTSRRKQTLLRSRTETTRAIGALIARLNVKPACLINASAVGFYGDRGEEALSEAAARGTGFTADLCEAWEAQAAHAAGADVRLVCLRFGLVLGRDGGAWPKLALPLRFGLGVRFGSGRQWMAWIHKKDAVRLIEWAMETPACRGAVNAVAPDAVRHGALMRAAARILGGRAILPAPAFALKTILGEMSGLFLDSQYVVAERASRLGFVFEFPTIEAALGELFSPLVQPASAESSEMLSASATSRFA